ncbi:hypothetical protein V501_01317 [Pseudogymnoascus sp. VKM F-4519 (FW-2642)]|nr:hypothetical protein V501_01317 [Pseudogymnoascus sp. VKM F-4519 (FW-2642)]
MPHNHYNPDDWTREERMAMWNIFRSLVFDATGGANMEYLYPGWGNYTLSDLLDATDQLYSVTHPDEYRRLEDLSIQIVLARRRPVQLQLEEEGAEAAPVQNPEPEVETDEVETDEVETDEVETGVAETGDETGILARLYRSLWWIFSGFV